MVRIFIVMFVMVMKIIIRVEVIVESNADNDVGMYVVVMVVMIAISIVMLISDSHIGEDSVNVGVNILACPQYLSLVFVACVLYLPLQNSL